MDSLTVSSSMLIPTAVNVEITPAMLTVIWNIAHELDRKRVPATVTDAVWLSIPSKRLRNPDGRTDNVWLRACFDRLMGMKLQGEYRGDEWGAVILAQWELIEGGSRARLLIPPAAVQAIRAPDTFTKIEITAAYRLKGHARRLYAALSDKKRQTQNLYHEYSIEELRMLFNIGKRYSKWYDFRRYVLDSAIEEINDYGTVKISMTPVKEARSIIGVRFDWKWKSLDDARVTDEENERHSAGRHKQSDGTAPPLTEDAKKLEQLNANRTAYDKWKVDNRGGTYGQFLDWKKDKA